MMKLMRYRFKTWCMIVILLTGSFYPVAFDAVAGLTSRIRNAIFTAYMNGYVAALKLDIVRIEAMKKDKKLMKTVLMEATREYLQQVEDMN
ncbi:MAG TPA: hypothetical protein HPQ03_10745 [Deltaproteobacteria bacterium]|nr:hypothetical protein [Deltaproteobacteria bacterium]